MVRHFGNFATKLGVIVLPMVMVQLAIWLESSVLFFVSFPDSMPYGMKLFAAGFMGLSVALTLLAVSVNSDFFKGAWLSFPKLFAACTFVMAVFFFQVFEPGQNWNDRSVKLFLSLLIALIEYVFATLFVKKWGEMKSNHSELESIRNELKVTQSELKSIQHDVTCKHCGTIHPTRRMVYHENTCKSNPKNQK
ncbi:MAG: hypothetical protein AAF363_15620 [Bacteroidota bacterium]